MVKALLLVDEGSKSQLSDTVEKLTIRHGQELERTLAEVFGIEDPEIQSIWPKIEARHAALFGERTLDQINDSDIEF